MRAMHLQTSCDVCVSVEEVRRQVGYCVRDGLLKHFKRVGIKGKKTGVEQEGYQVPAELVSTGRVHSYDFSASTVAALPCILLCTTCCKMPGEQPPWCTRVIYQ